MTAQYIPIGCGVTREPWAPIAVTRGWREALTVARAIKRAGLRVSVHNRRRRDFSVFGCAPRNYADG